MECLADESCERTVDGITGNFCFQVGDFNLYHEQCADGNTFVLVLTAHLEYLHDEVAVSDVKILLSASQKLAEEFGLGKGARL